MRNHVKLLTLITTNVVTYQCQVGIHPRTFTAEKKSALVSVGILMVFGNSTLLYYKMVSAQVPWGSKDFLWPHFILNWKLMHRTSCAFTSFFSSKVHGLAYFAFCHPGDPLISHTHTQNLTICGFQARESGCSTVCRCCHLGLVSNRAGIFC